MQNAQLMTFTVPAIPPADSGLDLGVIGPVAIAQADASPMRVLVRNISALGQMVSVSFDMQTLVNNVAGGGGTFVLPSGTSEIFVLAPRQRLFGASGALNAQVAVAISEALPLDLKP